MHLVARYPLELVLLRVFTHAASKLSRGTVLPNPMFCRDHMPITSWCRHQRSRCLYLYDSSWPALCRGLMSRRQAPDTTLAMERQQVLHLLQGLPTSSLCHFRMYSCLQLPCLIWMAGLHCWYAGLIFPIAVTTCAANRHNPCFPAVIVLMKSLPSKQQHLHASL
jgi:hypothetical protein